MAAAGSPEHVEAWDPQVAGVREVFHARFVDYAYPRHTHDAWTVLMVDSGAVRYALDRRDHGTAGSVVTLLPPHVTHDGRAATSRGFTKRVLYLDPDVVDPALIGHAVDRPTIVDEPLAAAIRALHDALRRGVAVLEADTRVALVAERLAAHLRGTVEAPVGAGGPGLLGDRGHSLHDGSGSTGGPDGAGPVTVADAVRDVLDADPAAVITLADLSAAVGASPTHLVRAFSRRFGLPPHAYLVGRRVDTARRLLLAGRPPADVAATVGFHDQAHLTRHFRRHVGTTPGRFRRPAA